MDFQKYNIKEKKQKEKGRKKKKERERERKKPINHPKTIYGVCLKKKIIVIIGYRNKN